MGRWQSGNRLVVRRLRRSGCGLGADRGRLDRRWLGRRDGLGGRWPDRRWLHRWGAAGGGVGATGGRATGGLTGGVGAGVEVAGGVGVAEDGWPPSASVLGSLLLGPPRRARGFAGGAGIGAGSGFRLGLRLGLGLGLRHGLGFGLGFGLRTEPAPARARARARLATGSGSGSAPQRARLRLRNGLGLRLRFDNRFRLLSRSAVDHDHAAGSRRRPEGGTGADLTASPPIRGTGRSSRRTRPKPRSGGRNCRRRSRVPSPVPAVNPRRIDGVSRCDPAGPVHPFGAGPLTSSIRCITWAGLAAATRASSRRYRRPWGRARLRGPRPAAPRSRGGHPRVNGPARRAVLDDLNCAAGLDRDLARQPHGSPAHPEQLGGTRDDLSLPTVIPAVVKREAHPAESQARKSSGASQGSR